MERYENLAVVGEGSYGVVLKCRHRETGQIVAVKKFLEGEDDPSVKKIALREVRMLKRLRHENLINLIEFFRRKRRLYLVFEYVDHTILDELEKVEGGLPESVAREHIFQVLRGIAFCHYNQIIHRDVKPENVLVSRLGVVKLCDFGFARPISNPGEAFTDYVATRWYRAPELLVGDTRYGKEVDVWAVGCLLAEMLTGDPLFPGESDIDQLFHIIQALGELSPYHKTLVEKNPMMSGLHLPAAASTPLNKTYPSWSPRAMAFIKCCLHIVPSDRPSAQTLLGHDFFQHDAFPDLFLKELRQKVQQEFSGNALLSKESRRSSGGGPKKSKRGRAGLLSPEAIYGKSVSHNVQPTKVEGAPRRNSIKSTVTSQSTTSSRGPGLAYGMMSERRGINIEDGPPSLPLSTTIPPLRDATNSNNNNYGGGDSSSSIFTLSSNVPNQNVPSTSRSNYAYSGSPNKANSLGLHISSLTSPSQMPDRGRKSPMNQWGAGGVRNKNSNTSVVSLPQSIDIRQQRSNSNPDDDDLNLTLLLTEAAMSIPSSNSQSTRHNNTFDLQPRHPYNISLDQTKELSYRSSTTEREFHQPSRDHLAREHLARDHLSRDPLNNFKDSGRPMKQEAQESTSSRKSKMEMSNWFKTKFSDDLSLPSVSGVGVNSPVRTSKAGDPHSGDATRQRRTTPGVSMPALSNNRTSASSGPQLATCPSYDPTNNTTSTGRSGDIRRRAMNAAETQRASHSQDQEGSSQTPRGYLPSKSSYTSKALEKIFETDLQVVGKSSRSDFTNAPSSSSVSANGVLRSRHSISAEYPVKVRSLPSSTTRSTVSAESLARPTNNDLPFRSTSSADISMLSGQMVTDPLPGIHGRRINLNPASPDDIRSSKPYTPSHESKVNNSSRGRRRQLGRFLVSSMEEKKL